MAKGSETNNSMCKELLPGAIRRESPSQTTATLSGEIQPMRRAPPLIAARLLNPGTDTLCDELDFAAAALCGRHPASFGQDFRFRLNPVI